MFTRVPVLIFTIILIAIAAANLFLVRVHTLDEMLPYRLLFAAWGVLTLARIVAEPVAGAKDASVLTTRVRVGEVIYWLTTAVAAIVALVMVDQTIFLGEVTPPDVLRLCLPALGFAVGRAARYVLAGY